MSHIPLPFLSFAADILADTSRGLSENEVVKAFNAYDVEYNIKPAPRPLPPMLADRLGTT